MRWNLLLVLLVLAQPLFAQTFTEVLSAPKFDGISIGSIAFSDVDGDDDQDVLLTGRKNLGNQIAKLYTNDGMGNFTEKTGTPFEGVRLSSIAFSDVDGDNDPDLLIAGEKIVFWAERIIKLYINDGLGNFSEKTGNPFDGLAVNAMAFSDVDGDNDQDLLITGVEDLVGGVQITKLYINDGMGNFTEKMGTPFEGILDNAIAFSDVDGDNDQDLLMTGVNNSFQRIAKLYINDGMANFTEKVGTPFDGVRHGSIAFSDVDGDNDQDLLITGEKIVFGPPRITKLYLNNGMGNFTEKLGVPFDGVAFSSIAFSDVDGDNDQDLFMTGVNNAGVRVAKLYSNDGMSNFTEKTGTLFEGVASSSIAFADVDGDDDPDLLITGENNSEVGIAKLYINDGMGNFTNKSGTPFEDVWRSSVAFSDVDGDNDPDLLITGWDDSGQRLAKMYVNNGTGNFTEKSDNPIDGVSRSSIAFSDVDGDNAPDLLITGYNNFSLPIAKLYTNDGMGNFTEMTGAPFDGVSSGSVAFSDVDGDNDPDLLITGQNYSGVLLAKMYTNDGMGNFTEKPGTPFDGVYYSSIAFSDVDGDNDPDLFITGLKNSGVPIAKLYINDGMGNFAEMTGASFDGVAFSSITFSDVDGDNDQDLLLTGKNWTLNTLGVPISKLYINDGIGNFTEKPGTPFDDVSSGSIAFSDVDGDNDLDLLITGENISGVRISKLYINDGVGNFTEKPDTPFDGVASSSIAFSDVDGDADPDLLITGENNSGMPIAKLYANDGMASSIDGLIYEHDIVITCYPNPTTSDILNVRFDSAENSAAIVKVHDLKGRLLSQQKNLVAIGQQTISVDIRSLSPGIYFIQLDNGKRKGVTRFIVQ